MGMLLWALVDRDFEAVADQLLHLSLRTPDADVRGFTTELGDLVEEWYGQRIADFSVARLLLRELAVGGRHGIQFPRELMLVARALVHLESTATLVDPTLDLAELTRPMLPDLQGILLPGPGQLQEVWRQTRLDYLALALELPEALPHLPAALAAPRPAGDRGRDPHPPRSWATGAALVAVGVAAGRLIGPRRAPR